MRILAVHNPKSGQGNAGFPVFLDALRRDGASVDVRVLQRDVPLPELLADAADFDRVVAAGGDGTVSAVAHALVPARVPLLAYPAGTANLIALNLRLPSDPIELAGIALHGDVMVTDLAALECVAGRAGEPEGAVRAAGSELVRTGFALIAGAGFDAAVIAGSEDLKSRLGAGAYVASAVARSRPTVAKFELDLDGRRVSTEGIGVLLLNFGRITLDLSVAPGVSAHDGVLDVVVLRAHSVAGLVPVVARAVAEKLGLRGPDLSGRLEVYQAREVRVASTPTLPVQFDGESIDGRTPLTARVLPGAARYLVARGAAASADDAAREAPAS